MGHYRKVETRIHADAKYRGLSDRAKLLFLTVLTHENMTSLGAMKAYPAAMAAEFGWQQRQYDEAFAECKAARMLEADPMCGFIWAVNFLRYNPPENPNVVAGWTKALDKIPECKLRNDLIEHVRAFLEPFPDHYRNRFSTVPKPFPNQEQEQEQEPKKKRGKRAAPTSAELDGFEEFWAEYPLKAAKEKAREAWAKSTPKRPPLETILQSLASAKASPKWIKDDGEYIPHAATWINQKRWTDDPAQAAQRKSAPVAFGSLRQAVDGMLAFDGRQYLTADEWRHLHPDLPLPAGLEQELEIA